jgi:hypothetical protein
MVDTLVLGTSALRVWVRVPPSVHKLRDRAEVACKAHNLEVGGSNPPPATKMKTSLLKTD